MNTRKPTTLLPAIWLTWALSGAGTGVLQAQETQPSFSEKTAIIYKNIRQHYYDSSAALYTEIPRQYTGEKPYSYLWPLCALIQAGNEMEVLQPGRSYMRPLMKSIDQYYSTRPPTPGYDSYVVGQGGGDRFFDDNQWIGLAYMDAYGRTKEGIYLQRSEEIYRFMMTGYDTVTGGGLYWKEGDKKSKNTCSNGPGVLLALRLYQATRKAGYLDTALLLYHWTNRHLLSPRGIYYDAIRTSGGRIDSAAYTYNTGTMLQANVVLYSITGNKKYLQEARRLADASLRTFYRNGRFPGNYWFNAVLVRGYQELYAIDTHNKIYLQAVIKDAENSWARETDSQRLIGPGPVKKLLDQAGYLEICARMAALQRSGF